METFCLAMAFSTSLYMSVLCIPSPQNIVKAYEEKTHETIKSRARVADVGQNSESNNNESNNIESNDNSEGTIAK